MGERLTASDVKKIEEEIEYRRLVERKRILNDVKEARAQGDLSENFEYYAAKKEKNRNDGRIRYLEKMLKYATIVDDTSKDDEVGRITQWMCILRMTMRRRPIRSLRRSAEIP